MPMPAPPAISELLACERALLSCKPIVCLDLEHWCVAYLRIMLEMPPHVHPVHVMVHVQLWCNVHSMAQAVRARVAHRL